MKSNLNRGMRPKMAVVLSVIGLLIVGWSSLLLPGRVPWLPYSFPASVTHVGEEVLVPVPSDAANGTQWRVETTLGPTPAADVLQLSVSRYLSTTKVNQGEDITIEGNRLTYVGLRRLTDGSTVVLLRHR